MVYKLSIASLSASGYNFTYATSLDPAWAQDNVRGSGSKLSDTLMVYQELVLVKVNFVKQNKI